MFEKLVRPVTKDEIKVRVQRVKEDHVALTLYVDARTVQNILDEAFSPFGWKREHRFVDGRDYCTISVYDEDKGEWVAKEDLGAESFLDKEKGQASDSFKRAAVNWGVARELYSLPAELIIRKMDLVQIVPKSDDEDAPRFWCYNNFSVHQLKIKDDKSGIEAIDIWNDDIGRRVFRYPPIESTETTTAPEVAVPSPAPTPSPKAPSAVKSETTEETKTEESEKPVTVTASEEKPKRGRKPKAESSATSAPVTSSPAPVATPEKKVAAAPVIPNVEQPFSLNELSAENARKVVADKGSAFVGKTLGEIEAMPSTLVWLYTNSLNDLVRNATMLIAKENPAVAQAFYAKGIAVR